MELLVLASLECYQGGLFSHNQKSIHLNTEWYSWIIKCLLLDCEGEFWEITDLENFVEEHFSVFVDFDPWEIDVEGSNRGWVLIQDMVKHWIQNLNLLCVINEDAQFLDRRYSHEKFEIVLWVSDEVILIKMNFIFRIVDILNQDKVENILDDLLVGE